MAESVEADVCRAPAPASHHEPEDALTLVRYVEAPNPNEQPSQDVAHEPVGAASTDGASRPTAVDNEPDSREADGNSSSEQAIPPSKSITNTAFEEENKTLDLCSNSPQLAPELAEADRDVTTEGQTATDSTMDATSTSQTQEVQPTTDEQVKATFDATETTELPAVSQPVGSQDEQTLKVAVAISPTSAAHNEVQEEKKERGPAVEAPPSEIQQPFNVVKPSEEHEGSVPLPESSPVQSVADHSSASVGTTEDDGNITLPSSIGDDSSSDVPEKNDDVILEANGVVYDHDQSSDDVVRLKPTADQWDDFPAILDLARKLGADKDGCFKVVLPEGLLGPVPNKAAQTVAANAYKPHQLHRNRIWQVGTIPTTARYPASDALGTPNMEEPKKAFIKLQKLFDKNRDRQLREVRYRVDVPAWNVEQRREAGVPEKSPFHPLKGDKLDKTKAIIPGIHTPYVYESSPAFGATFQIHAEDYRLSSLNHLYKGRKIWIVIPSDAVDLTEEKLERRGKCSQFMRHRAEFLFPTKLDPLGIPYRIIDQRPGETIVILPDAYHEGFSTGYTLAEAKNYAEPGWSAATYQPCDESCKLPTMIPAEYMELVDEGEQRIDLCALQDAEDLACKRKREEEEEADDEPEAQRPKLSAEVVSVG